MILLFSFLIAYPLITRHVDNGQRLAETFERWTQLQVAADSALQILASDKLAVPATYSYVIGSNSSFTISLTATRTSPLTDANRNAKSSVTAYVEHPTKKWVVGFDVKSISTQFYSAFNEMIATETPFYPASYKAWSNL